MHIFISYAKKDTFELANELDQLFDSLEGVTAWMDRELRPDSSWAEQIKRQIDRCDLFLVLISPDVNRPETDEQDHSFVKNEIYYAKSVKRPMVVVMAQATSLPLEINTRQYIDLTRNRSTGIEQIITEVCKRAGIETPAEKRARAEQQTRQERVAEEKARLDAELGESRQREKAAVLLQARQRLASNLLPIEELVKKHRSWAEIDQALQGLRTQIREFPELAGALELKAKEFRTTWDTEEERLQRQREIEAQQRREQLAKAAIAPPRQQQTQTTGSKKWRIGVVVIIFALVAVGVGWVVKLQFFPGYEQSNYDPISPVDADALALAEAGIIRNADWTPVSQTFNGIEMVLVPKGCFTMGSETGADDEKPTSQQCFDQPFWLDRTEVTQGDFERLGGQKTNPNAFEGANHPVERITWYEAQAFCQQRGGRLPTEREWEYAARGPDNLVYPWGNVFIGANVVYDASQTAEVGSRPQGTSWAGALDMSGNVWEWTASKYQDYPYVATDGREDLENISNNDLLVLRGGSFFNYDSLLRGAYRNRNDPNYVNDNNGFRCALPLN